MKIPYRYTVILFMAIIFGCYLVENHSYATTVSNVPFDNQTYFYDHDFTLTLNDPSSANAGIKTIKILVTSDVDSHQYPLDLDSVSGTYKSLPINFTTLSSSTNSTLKIPDPSTSPIIKAFYPSTTFLAQSTITGSDYGTIWPPIPMNPQPLWGKNIYDCSTYGGDSDRDGVCDDWENQTNFHGLKIPFLAGAAGFWTLPCDTSANYSNDPSGDRVCPGNDMPDVYVEADWMKGHVPDQTAINDVVRAFTNAPVKTCDSTGLICKTGVRLHVIMGEEIPYHRDTISVAQRALAGGSGVLNPTEFDAIKQAYFGTPSERIIPTGSGWTYNEYLTSKKQVFHYALFVHSQADAPTSSGVSEAPGNDIVISLGRFTGAVGSTDQQEGTFMHELGHNLGLQHGGDVQPTSTNLDPDNCKPNYLSVMNYLFQLNESFSVNRPLDYSHNKLAMINEGNINEKTGIGPSIPPDLQTVYGVSNGQLFKTTKTDASGYQKLWLTFDDNSLDSSGNGHNGNIIGTTTNDYSTIAKVGSKSFSFDTKTRVESGNLGSFPAQGTISFWMNPSTVENYRNPLTTNYNGGNSGIRLEESVTGSFVVVIGNDAGTYGVHYFTTNGIAANTWYHVVLTWDTTTNNVKGYLNNTKVFDESQVNWPTTIPDFAVGTGLNINSIRQWNGLVDDVQVWNYPFTQTDVTNLYNGQQKGIDANNNGIIDTSQSSNTFDINKIAQSGCDGTELNPNILTGFDDWSNLQYNSKTISSWLDGIRVYTSDITHVSETIPTAAHDIVSQVKLIDFSPSNTTINTPGMLGSNPSSQTPTSKPYGIFEYNKPHLQPTKESADRLEQWLQTWGWKLKDHGVYYLPKEITIDDVKAFRKDRISNIDYSIQNLPNSAFYNATNNKQSLHNDLTTAIGQIMNDNLYDASHKLLDIENHIQQFIIDPGAKSFITSKIDSDIQSLKIASTISAPQSCPSTVELDKKVFTWTDIVYITITSPCHNTDPNMINFVNATIHTTSNNISNYKLAETGVDTGIFTGYVTLTGNPNIKGASGVDGSGLNPSGTGPSGTGPTNGFLPAAEQDGISVSFGPTNDQIVTGSALIRWNMGDIKWLGVSYPTNGQGVLQITDPDMNLNPKAVDKFDTNVWSDSDSGGIKLTMTETGEATGIFQGTVYFTTNFQSSGNRLHVASGDTVTAEYKDRTLPLPYTPSDQFRLTSTTSIGTPKVLENNPRVTDNMGNVITVAQSGTSVKIITDMTNNQASSQPFTHLTEIQDNKGMTISQFWINGTLAAGQTLNPTQSWIPQAPGTYTIKLFTGTQNNSTLLGPPLTFNTIVK